jgi:hypothetical protein
MCWSAQADAVAGGLVAGAGHCALLWCLAFVSTWCALAALVSLLLLRWAGHPPWMAADLRARRLHLLLDDRGAHVPPQTVHLPPLRP